MSSRLASIAVAAALVSSSLSATAASLPASLAGGDGCVEHGSSCGAVAPHGSLAVGERFRAGPNGATVTLRDGSSVVVEPAASIRIGRPITAGAASGPLSPSLEVLDGTVIASLAPNANAPIVVFAPNEVEAVVKRGSATISAVGARVRAEASSGTTMLSPDKTHWLVLRGGESRTLEVGKAPVADDVVGPPAWSAIPELVVDAFSGAQPLEVSWTPVARAAAYDLLVTRDGERAPAFVRRVGSPRATLGAVGPGSYRLEVRALDAGGLPGRASSPASIHVAHLGLPAGATATGDLVHVYAGAPLHLDGEDGVEASIDGRPFAAASVIPLEGKRARHVRLRKTGSAAEIGFNVVSSRIVASVEAGPGTATWPRDPVHVRVHLESEEGLPLPPSVVVEPRVMLGSSAISTAWTRDGDTVSATIEPRDLPGPAVLWVFVDDPTGSPSGFGFLELVPDDFQHPTIETRGALEAMRIAPLVQAAR